MAREEEGTREEGRRGRGRRALSLVRKVTLVFAFYHHPLAPPDSREPADSPPSLCPSAATLGQGPLPEMTPLSTQKEVEDSRI